MLHSLLTTTFRFLLRDRFFTLLNITGLAAGMTAAVLLFLWVQDERTFDQFHTNGDRVYRVLTNWQFGENREWTSSVPAPLKDEALESTPGIETMARTLKLGEETFSIGANRIALDDVVVVENGFFNIFHFKFLIGNPETALVQPASVVLTESAALKVFGKIPPLGATIQLDDKGVFAVAGILEDFPSNSSVRFDAAIPWESNVNKFFRNPKSAFSWGQINFPTWVLLRPDADAAEVASRFSAVAGTFRSSESALYFALQNIRDIHFYSGFLRWSDGLGSLQTIRLVSIIGFMVLLVACINYVNLTTARARSRAKSVGIRQTIGASKGHLFAQALLESGITVAAALGLAVLLMWQVLPWFETFGGKTFTKAQLYGPQTIGVLGFTALAAWVLSSIQPALQLTRFKPVTAMKGEAPTAGTAFTRKSLVVGQFVFSIGLGICSLVIYKQLEYARNKSLGFDRSHTFMVFAPGNKAMMLKNELQQQAGIVATTLCDNPFVNLGSQCSGDNWEGKTPDQPSDFWQINVDSDFPDMFGLQLKEGRWFTPGNTDTLSFVINETAVKMMQIDNPVGKWFDHGGGKGHIVGVAKDFHFQSLHTAIEPMIFTNDPNWFFVLHVKTTGGQAQQAIATARQAFQKIYPEKVFKYEFLDEQYDALYKSDARIGGLTGLFTGLALFISCLGLFGLAAFAAAQRTKEIGVRKVLGASVANLTALLTHDFLKLTAVAIVIASPVAYGCMHWWLADFAYHIHMGWEFFAVAGVLALFITFLTVGWQAIKAAVMDPVTALRRE
jgi:putative ABC transport system permease protein